MGLLARIDLQGPWCYVEDRHPALQIFHGFPAVLLDNNLSKYMDLNCLLAIICCKGGNLRITPSYCRHRPMIGKRPVIKYEIFVRYLFRLLVEQIYGYYSPV